MLKYKYIERGYESDKLENFVFNSIYTKSIWESKLDWKRFQSFERKMQKKKNKIISMDSPFSDNYLTGISKSVLVLSRTMCSKVKWTEDS